MYNHHRHQLIQNQLKKKICYNSTGLLVSLLMCFINVLEACRNKSNDELFCADRNLQRGEECK